MGVRMERLTEVEHGVRRESYIEDITGMRMQAYKPLKNGYEM